MKPSRKKHHDLRASESFGDNNMPDIFRHAHPAYIQQGQEGKILSLPF